MDSVLDLEITQINVKITVSLEQQGCLGEATGVAVCGGMLRLFLQCEHGGGAG